MFNGSYYRQTARKQLQGRYTTAVLATLFFLAVMCISQIPLVIRNLTAPGIIVQTKPSLLSKELMFFAFSILSMAYTYLIIAYSHTTEKLNFKTFIRGFSYMINGLLGSLWFVFWTALWSLLLIVPGIVKAISYSQMFFILAEYPDAGVIKAMKLSQKITEGNKRELFTMALSFLPLEILCLCTFEIGRLWLTPYEVMSFTNAYHDMKSKAIKNGVLRQEDFTSEI